ncbi:MAG: hypothetical protein NT132_06495 [Microbacterium sp.]|uniref:hypothetical protein n=1 Tax=Microbacterium sp. TaxID=51671 RepID=UPI002616C9C2|nr:hypothetical protein [Microbacterium sp.]MCX6502040.1 hypothetical protein [Microbacterium sp.]
MSTPEDEDATRITRRGTVPVPDDDATRITRRGVDALPDADTDDGDGADDATQLSRRPTPVDDDATRITRRPASAPVPVDDDATRITRRPAVAQAPAMTPADTPTSTGTQTTHVDVGPRPAETDVAPALRTPVVRSAPPALIELPDPTPNDGGAAARAARRRILRNRLLILAGTSVVVFAGALVGLVLLISA